MKSLWQGLGQRPIVLPCEAKTKGNAAQGRQANTPYSQTPLCHQKMMLDIRAFSML